MDASERQRLRERLNFPSPTPDDIAATPQSPATPGSSATPASSATRERPAPAPEAAPETPASPADASGHETAATGVAAAADAADDTRELLERLVDVAERLDVAMQATRVDIERLHERIERLELSVGAGLADVDELAGLEAVRRTVSASHRALATQLGRMFEGLEGRLRRGDDPVLAGPAGDPGRNA